MAIILGVVIFCLLTITALGIVGMASFWVAQRTRQIGTRRALGATKFDILRYFQTENFIITTLGLIGGGILAYAFSLYLMSAYQAPRLPWYYVPVGFVCLWLLGQLAVLGPALRASRVPPAVATRSVWQVAALDTTVVPAKAGIYALQRATKSPAPAFAGTDGSALFLSWYAIPTKLHATFPPMAASKHPCAGAYEPTTTPCARSS